MRARRAAWFLLGVLLGACAPAAPEEAARPHHVPYDSMVSVWEMARLTYHTAPEGGSWLSIATRGDGRGSFVQSAGANDLPRDRPPIRLTA